MELIEYTNSQNETLRGLVKIESTDKASIFIHGFERTTIENKFRDLYLRLKGKQTTLRFDFAGCGISDGDFFDSTVEKMERDLAGMIEALDKRLNVRTTINLVGHSLGACVAATYAVSHPERVGKIVLLAPALNQKSLIRFWFAQNYAKKQGLSQPVTWNNYTGLVHEELLREMYLVEKRQTKTHEISAGYFNENQGRDYQDELIRIPVEKVLLVHSQKDDKVPLESNNRIPAEVTQVLLPSADHDMERVQDLEYYADKLVEFLTKE